MESECRIVKLYPPIVAHTKIECHEDSLEIMPQVTILGSESVMFRDVVLDCMGASIKIGRCSVEVLQCTMVGGKYCRAFRVKDINCVKLCSKAKSSYNNGQRESSLSMDILSVQDDDSTEVKWYIVDHYYDTEMEVKSRGTLETLPDLRAVLHLVTGPFGESYRD